MQEIQQCFLQHEASNLQNAHGIMYKNNAQKS
jgi:hypothetical protein